MTDRRESSPGRYVPQTPERGRSEAAKPPEARREESWRGALGARARVAADTLGERGRDVARHLYEGIIQDPVDHTRAWYHDSIARGIGRFHDTAKGKRDVAEAELSAAKQRYENLEHALKEQGIPFSAKDKGRAGREISGFQKARDKHAARVGQLEEAVEHHEARRDEMTGRLIGRIEARIGRNDERIAQYRQKEAKVLDEIARSRDWLAEWNGTLSKLDAALAGVPRRKAPDTWETREALAKRISTFEKRLVRHQEGQKDLAQRIQEAEDENELYRNGRERTVARYEKRREDSRSTEEEEKIGSERHRETQKADRAQTDEEEQGRWEKESLKHIRGKRTYETRLDAITDAAKEAIRRNNIDFSEEAIKLLPRDIDRDAFRRIVARELIDEGVANESLGAFIESIRKKELREGLSERMHTGEKPLKESVDRRPEIEEGAGGQEQQREVQPSSPPSAKDVSRVALVGVPMTTLGVIGRGSNLAARGIRSGIGRLPRFLKFIGWATVGLIYGALRVTEISSRKIYDKYAKHLPSWWRELITDPLMKGVGERGSRGGAAGPSAQKK